MRKSTDGHLKPQTNFSADWHKSSNKNQPHSMEQTQKYNTRLLAWPYSPSAEKF